MVTLSKLGVPEDGGGLGPEPHPEDVGDAAGVLQLDQGTAATIGTTERSVESSLGDTILATCSCRPQSSTLLGMLPVARRQAIDISIDIW
jgi:hypothetical protein